MRKITLVLLALAAVALTDTPADAGSWCANYRRGVSNCGYDSFEQCGPTAGPRRVLLADPLSRTGVWDLGRKLEPARRVQAIPTQLRSIRLRALSAGRTTCPA